MDEITDSTASSTIAASSIQGMNDIVQRSIYDVIIQNDVEQLTELLSNHITFNINQPLRVKEILDDKNALMIACSLDCFDIVKYLLTHMNINIDMQGNF